jgi:hypothetical protein
MEYVSIFKQHCIQFVDALIELFPEESDLFVARFILKDQLTPEQMVEGFSVYVEPFVDMIRDRNEAFFMERSQDSTAPEWVQVKVTRIKELWTSPQLDDDNKGAIWEWVHLLATLGQRARAGSSIQP